MRRERKRDFAGGCHCTKVQPLMSKHIMVESPSFIQALTDRRRWDRIEPGHSYGRRPKILGSNAFMSRLCDVIASEGHSSDPSSAVPV